MNQETRQCQNCHQEFRIEPDDFAFYEQIKVPAPTFCPDCRAAQRMLWRNERTYYKRKCNAPGHTEEIISLHAPDVPFIVYDQIYWWSDGWNPLDYGREYDFSKPFFQQYQELLGKIPLIALSNTSSVNSEYSSSAAWNKDCYLVSGGGWNEKNFIREQDG
jgi:glutaredoxin